jgi:6-pyruvoyltetrahydropterin/6-carboxytetrahydropterin synthase
MFTVDIRHNFETAHRLAAPGSPVKCMSIHGHSWWATFTFGSSTLDALSMVIEFGAIKALLRRRMDDTLDHHLVLQEGDPLVGAIRGVMPGCRILEVPFAPTTERMAAMLHGWAVEALAACEVAPEVRVVRVHVQETSVNGASYEPV